MIPISNIFTNNTFVNIAQSTRSAMSIETGLKATGRPAFILADKNISNETKKYAATKELLYQLTCLAVYLILVLPVFRKGGFQVFKKIYKNNPRFDNFRKLDEFTEYSKLRKRSKAERLEFIQKNPEFFTKNINEELSAEKVKNAKKYSIVKGADEFSSIVGSVLGLAILSPQVSHVTIHPIMNMLGLKNPNEKHTQQEEQKNKEIAVA